MILNQIDIFKNLLKIIQEDGTVDKSAFRLNHAKASP